MGGRYSSTFPQEDAQVIRPFHCLRGAPLYRLSFHRKRRADGSCSDLDRTRNGARRYHSGHLGRCRPQTHLETFSERHLYHDSNDTHCRFLPPSPHRSVLTLQSSFSHLRSSYRVHTFRCSNRTNPYHN